MKSQEEFYNVILSPVVTEKAVSASESGKVVFKVMKDASKQQIKKAIEALFKVKIVKVAIVNVKPKTRRFKGISGKTKSCKKAIISLAEGYSIDINEGV